MTRLSGNTFTEQPETGELLNAYDEVQAVLAEDAHNPRALRYQTLIEALLRDREEEYWQGLVAQAVESAFNGDFFAADHALARATLYPLNSRNADQPHAPRAQWIATGRALIGAMRELAVGNLAAARQMLTAAPRTTPPEREWANKADKLIDLAALDETALNRIAQQLRSDVDAPTPQTDPLPLLDRSALPSGRTRPPDFPENLYAVRLRSEVPTAKQQDDYKRLHDVMEQARRSGDLAGANDAIHQMRALMPPQYRPQLDTWASGLDQIHQVHQEMRQWADRGRPDKALVLLNRLQTLTPDNKTLLGLQTEYKRLLRAKPLWLRNPALLWAGGIVAVVLLVALGAFASRAIFTLGAGTPSPTAVGPTATARIAAPPITPTLTLTVAVASPASVTPATAVVTATLVPDIATAGPVITGTATSVMTGTATSVLTITGTLSLTATLTPIITPTVTLPFTVRVAGGVFIRASADGKATPLATTIKVELLTVLATAQDSSGIIWYKVTIPKGYGSSSGSPGWVSSDYATRLTQTPTPKPTLTRTVTPTPTKKP